MKSAAKYKELTIKEFSKVADIYETGHAGIYEMCKDDYPYISEQPQPNSGNILPFIQLVLLKVEKYL